MTLTASNGAVTIKSKPDRIISLSPTATEDLYAVGAGSQVVAVDSDSNYPATAPVTSLSGLTPNLEAIAKYHPDLVIAPENSDGLVSGLTKLGIPVLASGEKLDRIFSEGEASNAVLFFDEADALFGKRS